MFDIRNSNMRKHEEVRIARELGEIFSGESSEYFGEDDTPTQSFPAIKIAPVQPATVKFTTLRDFAPVSSPSSLNIPPRTEFTNEDLPIYVTATACIAKHFLDHKVWPSKVCIHKSAFGELMIAIVCVTKEPFRPNILPITYGVQTKRHEDIEIVFNSNISKFTVICTH